LQLEGCVSVITGGANGIGLAVGLALARLRGSVVLADLDEGLLAAATAAVRAAGGTPLAVRCDVTRDEDVEHLASAALERFGHVDLVMANAGRPMGGRFEAITTEDWKRLYDVNVFGVVRTIRAFLPHLSERGRGRIVITSSSIALAPDNPFAAPYGSSKAALVTLAQQLELYVRRRGLGVTLLCPALTNTNFPRSVEVIGLPAPAPDEASLARADTADDVAALLLDGLRHDRFLVAARAADRPLLERRIRDLEETTALLFGDAASKG